MASITRREVAAILHRKMDDLGGGLRPTEVGTDQPEGDYTDSIDNALRICRFSAITEADSDDKILAILAAGEYFITQRLLNKWVARPTTQQGAGASGLHLMVQTESTIASLRMNVKTLRLDMQDALSRIGVKLSGTSGVVAGVAEIDHDDDLTGPMVYGDHPLPWYEESYWDKP